MYTILKLNHPHNDPQPAEILGVVSSITKADQLVREHVASQGGGPYSFSHREYKPWEKAEHGDMVRIYTYGDNDFKYRLIVQYWE